MHFPCRMQCFLKGFESSETSSSYYSDSTALELESAILLFLEDFFSCFSRRAWKFFLVFLEFQVFYLSFKEFSNFFDGQICVVENLFNNLVFLCGGHGMIDNVLKFFSRKRCKCLPSVSGNYAKQASSS